MAPLKKFYEQVSVAEGKAGFEVRLDGKPVLTPKKAVLAVPAKILAGAIAEEWMEQEETVDPETLPLTRLANTALDVTAAEREKVEGELAAFARHDLLCYRAEAPADLAEKEMKMWDSYLGWARETFGIALATTAGITPLEQDAKAITALEALLSRQSPFMLTALHNATTLLGSVILALALAEGFRKPDDIWRAAHVDEDYQTAKWGKDADAEKVRAARHDLFTAVTRFMAALAEPPSSGKRA